MNNKESSAAQQVRIVANMKLGICLGNVLFFALFLHVQLRSVRGNIDAGLHGEGVQTLWNFMNGEV